MSDQAAPTAGDGRPPPQTPTGEIKDQRVSQPPTPEPDKKTEPTKTVETPESKKAEPATSSQETGDQSLLNKGQEDKKTEAKAPAPGAPEKYEDFKVPEGYELDEGFVKDASALFKGLGLDQAGAQSLVDEYIKRTQDAFQQPFKAYRDMRSGWVKDAQAHPELKDKLTAGGPVLTSIAKALDGLGDPALANEFRQVMDLTGAGDHPAFIRVFYKMAERLTEGKPVSQGGPSAHGQKAPGGAQRSLANAVYPNLP